LLQHARRRKDQGIAFDCIHYDKKGRLTITSMEEAGRAILRVSNFMLALLHEKQRTGDVNPLVDFVIKSLSANDMAQRKEAHEAKMDMEADAESTGRAVSSTGRAAAAAAASSAGLSRDEAIDLSVDESMDESSAPTIRKKVKTTREAKEQNKKTNQEKARLKDQEGYINLSNSVVPIIHSCTQGDSAMFPHFVLKALSAYVTNDESIFQKRKPLKDQNSPLAQMRLMVSQATNKYSWECVSAMD